MIWGFFPVSQGHHVIFFVFSSLFFTGQAFAHVLGLGAWLFPRVLALFRREPWLLEFQPIDVDVDVDVDIGLGIDVDIDVDIDIDRTLAGTGKGMNIKDNIKQ